VHEKAKNNVLFVDISYRFSFARTLKKQAQRRAAMETEYIHVIFLFFIITSYTDFYRKDRTIPSTWLTDPDNIGQEPYYQNVTFW